MHSSIDTEKCKETDGKLDGLINLKNICEEMDELISKKEVLVAVEDALIAWSSMPEWRDEKILEAIAKLPPAEPEKYTEERTETHSVCLDVISRQAAINALGEKPLAWEQGEYEEGLQTQWESDVEAIKALPSAESQRIRGRWIYSSYDDESGFDESWTCDKCGYMINIEETNFCPNCGSYNRGKIND